MTEFKRSPSKFSWDNELLELRGSCTSPGSQDSGFSDTETLSNLGSRRIRTRKVTQKNDTKDTPIYEWRRDRLVKSETKPKPKKIEIERYLTDPICKRAYASTSPKVRRNLFNSKQKNVTEAHQYSENVHKPTNASNTSREVPVEDSSSSGSEQAYDNKSDGLTPERSEDVSEGSDKEVEYRFDSILDNPKFTSTPKIGGLEMCHRREKMSLNLFVKYQLDRVPPIPRNVSEIDNEAVQTWIKEARQNYEQECMTTLQCKSITGELNQKICQLAACATTIIRAVIHDARRIEMEYEKLNGEIKHIESLVQSLTGNIMDFLKTYTQAVSSEILHLYDKIRLSKFEDSMNIMYKLYTLWDCIRHDILAEEINKIVSKLECPSSEIDLRATVTAITSLALRNQDLLELFVKEKVIPVLLILCEKCQGSSSRSLILRTLSTMCCNSMAVRQFETFSGVHLVTEILADSRPEPEKSEAVALLVQVTAPWLEDNESVKGLKECSCQLVQSLTEFLVSTRCCQNILLCAAALANLSTMYPDTAKYMVQYNTAGSLIEVVNGRGPRASIYLLEQLSTLIANMSSIEVARKHLVALRAPTVLLYFLKKVFVGSDAVRRLQQKSIIALSRLCGECEAAYQVVEFGGIEKLVKMCRERQERYDSDAVLVAALTYEQLLAKVTDYENKLKTKDQELANYKTRVSELEENVVKIHNLKQKMAKEAEEVESLKCESEQTITKAKSIIFERTKVIKNQELQIEAYKQQIDSLKDVVRITKDLLEIRNLEVKQLENKINCMEEKIKAEKERQDLLHKKLETMIRHNGELKREYETQLCLFSALRERYTERELAREVIDDLKNQITTESIPQVNGQVIEQQKDSTEKITETKTETSTENNIEIVTENITDTTKEENKNSTEIVTENITDTTKEENKNNTEIVTENITDTTKELNKKNTEIVTENITDTTKEENKNNTEIVTENITDTTKELNKNNTEIVTENITDTTKEENKNNTEIVTENITATTKQENKE